VRATRLVSSSGQTFTPESPGNSQPGGFFKFQADTQSYRFNLKTTGLAAGTYTFYFTAGNDPVEHGIEITIV
jgi:hypothetical protein